MQHDRHWNADSDLLATDCLQSCANAGLSDSCKKLGRSFGCKIEMMLDNDLPKRLKLPDSEKSLKS